MTRSIDALATDLRHHAAEYKTPKGVTPRLLCEAAESLEILRGMFRALEEENVKLRRVADAVTAMKENLICGHAYDGTLFHGWYIIAPCEFGEAVDDALAALEAKGAKSNP